MPTPTPDEIEARIAAWHAAPGDGTPLHAALGWTHEEYERWVHDPNAAPDRPLPASPGTSCGATASTPELWCVHIPGPDDIYAHPDRAAAEKHAGEFNTFMRAYWQRNPQTENDPTEASLTAVVIPWPWSAESHAEALRDAN